MTITLAWGNTTPEPRKIRSSFGFNCLVLMLSTVPGLAGTSMEEPENKVTIEGEVLDLGCYTSREARGPDHAACAARCIGSGTPAGLIDAGSHRVH